MNDALIEIMSTKPHRIRKNWLDDRKQKSLGLRVDNKNLRVSRLIEKLNDSLILIKD